MLMKLIWYQIAKKQKGFPSYSMFYNALFSKGKVIKEFNPKDLNSPGPLVKVVEIL